MPGVSFAGTWEIQTLSMVVQVFGAVTSLAVRAFIADVEAIGGRTSLEDVWKIKAESPLADICRICIETSL